MGQAESKEQTERAPQSSAETTLAAPATASQQTLTEPPDTISQGTGEGQRHSETTATTADSGATMSAGSSWGGLRRSLSTGLGWTASSLEALKTAEEKILATVPGLKVFDTNIGNGQHIHTVEGGKENESQAPIVLCHGYGMGVAAWQLVLSDLSSSTHVLAKDWLGCGQSSRPKWEAKGVAETEAFFVESLEKWREANGFEKMTLCGHSLGGYMGVAYAEKYPERLERLVLVSPVGFPEEPEGYRAAIDEAPFSRRNLWRFLMWGWKKGITPGDVVRTLGPMGYRMMMTYSERRFLADFDRQAMGDYLYHNLAATDGSGERALNQVLKPGAWAHSPLRHRLPKINSSIPVHFIYGDHDWMDATAVEELKEAAEAEETGQIITIARIPSSGHQLFLDNPKGFSAELLRVCGIDVAGLVDDGRE